MRLVNENFFLCPFSGLHHLLTDVGIGLPGLFIPFHVLQQLAELVTVDGVCVRLWKGKALRVIPGSLEGGVMGKESNSLQLRGSAMGRELSVVLTLADCLSQQRGGTRLT